MDIPMGLSEDRRYERALDVVCTRLRTDESLQELWRQNIRSVLEECSFLSPDECSVLSVRILHRCFYAHAVKP